jgi:hypothetical protein
MTQEEKMYWTGNAVFVTATGAGLYVVFDHAMWGAVFIIIGLAGLVFSIIERPSMPRINSLLVPMIAVTWLLLWYDYYDRHHGDFRTALRLGKFEFEHDTGTPEIDLRPNKVTTMNLGINNFGPLPAFDVGMAMQIQWSPILGKSAENDSWNLFRKSVPVDNPVDLDVGRGKWGTYRSQPLTQRDIEDISAGREVLYVFMYWRYSDPSVHEPELCLYLQTPFSTSTQPVWINCNGHNKVR